MPLRHRSRSFNGAAVFQPRKCRCRACRWPAIVRFNGAAVFQPRKWSSAIRDARRTCRLQWGRGLSTAEIGRVCTSRRPLATWLQWGRGLSTAEMTAADCRREPCRHRLQWGRGLSTAEIRGTARIDRSAGVAASMGPRSFNRGNADGCSLDRSSTRASMGPRSFNRGNARRFGRRDRCRQLQWGRGLSTAEMARLANRCQHSRYVYRFERLLSRGHVGILQTGQCRKTFQKLRLRLRAVTGFFTPLDRSKASCAKKEPGTSAALKRCRSRAPFYPSPCLRSYYTITAARRGSSTRGSPQNSMHSSPRAPAGPRSISITRSLLPLQNLP